MTPAHTEITLHRDGLTLSAHRFGEPDAPLVILMHGFPDTPHSWDAAVPPLVAAGYQVLAPWLRGYTLGSYSRTARYDLPAVAADIAAWQHEFGGAPAHLVGHDWGAFAAIHLAKTAPQQWKSLSVLAIPPFGGRAAARSTLPYLPRQTLMSSYIGLMQSAAAPRLLARSDAALVRRIWARWSPGWAFTDDQFAPTRAVFTDQRLGWAATRYYRALFRAHRPETREFYRILTAPPAPLPTLALAGADDGCLHPGLQRALADSVGAHAIQLPGCGHFLHAELPEQVAAQLLSHFRNSD
ncbi:alpha/beta hydrolase [Nocardia sp. NPDC050710]|uniref:alpha/beta fold hydrolase n=1 Tax=Nocardia sp. NPDC050710 TaxID=3157220 RepID=UPI0033F5CDE9